MVRHHQAMTAMEGRTARLIAELKRLSRARSRAAASAWTAALIGGLAAVLMAYHLADLALVLHPHMRLGLRAALLSASLAGAAGAAFLMAYRRTPLATAAWLEARKKNLRQDISTVVQCAGRSGYSADLVGALAAGALERLEADPPGAGRTAVRAWRAAAVSVAMMAAVVLARPGEAGISLSRLARPWGVIGDWSRIDVVPGDSRVPSGEEMPVEVRGAGGLACVLMAPSGGAAIAKRMEPGEDGLRVRLPRAEGDFVYRVFLGRMQSRAFRVAVNRPLALEGISVRIEPPVYTGLAPAEMPNQGSVEAVRGSVVRVKATATKPLGTVRAVFADGRSAEAVVSGADASLSFRVLADDRYRLMALSPDGADTFVSAEYPVAAVPDQPPRAELYGEDVPESLGDDMTVTVEGGAGDDFGLSRIGIGYLIQGHEGYGEAMVLGRAVTDTSVELEWSLANMGLLPGDSVVYWLDVLDNDAFSGPKRGRSRPRILRVPSLAEMYQAMAERDSAVAAELAGIRPEQTELREQMARLSQAIKESRRIEWPQQAAIEKALADQQELLSRLERAADQALESMRPDGRRVEIDAETASKLRELHQLFDQVATDEMRQAVERLSRALEKMDRQEVAKALERMNLTGEELRRRLDEAIAALRELQQEKQLERIKEGLDRLAQEQREIRQRTGEARDSDQAEQLSERQKQAAGDLEALAAEARQLGAQMEAQPEAGEKLKQSNDRLQKRGTPSKMRQAGQRISQGDRRGAMDLQQQALEELAEMSQGIEAARSSMSQARGRARAEAMRRKAREALALSQQQEDLNRMMREGGSTNDLAERQQSLSRAGARLLGQGGDQRAEILPPRAAGEMARALRAMDRAGQEMMGGRVGQSQNQGQEAVAALNQAAAAMLESSSGSPGSQGGGEMMSELEGLSGRQSEVNQQTMGLMPGEGARQEPLPQEVRSRMARLAAEQEAVRQGLEDFNLKYADRRDRTDRLEDLVSEMQKAAEDLRQHRADERTRERQERILNRLLQAQRSLRDQDFSQQRKAEPGKAQGAKDGVRAAKPGQAPIPPPDRDWRNEPYPMEYREIIEKYFRSLGW